MQLVTMRALGTPLLILPTKELHAITIRTHQRGVDVEERDECRSEACRKERKERNGSRK